MAAKKLLSLGQFPLLNNSLKCVNVLKKDYSKKKILEAVGVPPKPKKPGSAYLTFQVAERVEVAARNPGKTFGEISKILGTRWNNMSDFEKSKYIKAYEEKLAEYKSQLHEYYQNYGRIDKNDLKEIESRIGTIKLEKKEMKDLQKENNKPEFPNSPYKFFVQEHMPKMELPVKDRMQKCAQKWKNMSEREKENFKKIYQQKYEQYINELNKWEENMIKQGKHYLVRPETLKHKFTNK